ncbi:glutaredoxin family protein [Psychrobacillus psychrodurans]|uniref:glutaredoxin family protein n=1 Tax=Psychrobacillus psychrodurans TaxID=126157 RepID=UPI003D050738
MNSVTVYTTTQCPYCVMLKNFLSEQNISFNEVNGQWIIGFDPNNIMIALRNRGEK